MKRLKTAAWTLLSIPLMISCGNATATEVRAAGTEAKTTTRDSILLSVPYKETSMHYRLFVNIVDGYNRYLSDTGDTQHLPVTIQNAGSYHKSRDDIINRLEVNNNDDIPSLIINYGSVISSIARYERGLEFVGIDKARYSEKFLDAYYHIQGVDNSKDWLLPLGSSTDIESINAPMYSWIVSQLVQAGATIDPKSKDFFANIHTLGAHDRKYVETVIGPVTTDKKVLGEIRKLRLSRENLTDVESLFKLCALIKRAFPKYAGHIIGLDSIEGLITNVAFARLGNDYENYLFKVAPRDKNDTHNEMLVTELMFTPGTPQYKVLGELYELTRQLYKSGALRLPAQDGDYSTHTFRMHQLVFTIASSAGWSYYQKVIEGDDTRHLDTNEMAVLAAPGRINNRDTYYSVLQRGPSLFGISHTQRENESAMHFVRWMQSQKNWTYQESPGKMKSVDITPAQYFGLSGGYLTIEQQQLLSPLPADKSEDLFYKAGFDAFRSVAEDKTGTRGTFREPSADGVEAMRRAMRGGIVKALYDDEDFNAFLAAIKNALVGANE